MKKTFIPLLATVAFLSMGIISNAQSHQSIGSNPLGFTPLISNAALSQFNKMYGNASNAKWFAGKTGFIAYAEQDGKKIKAEFNRKGKMQYSITYYTDQNRLPSIALHLIKENYSKKSVFGITEVNVNNTTAYLVTLEDARSFSTVKVLDGEIYPGEVIYKLD